MGRAASLVSGGPKERAGFVAPLGGAPSSPFQPEACKYDYDWQQTSPNPPCKEGPRPSPTLSKGTLLTSLPRSAVAKVQPDSPSSPLPRGNLRNPVFVGHPTSVIPIRVMPQCP